jgi:hypothetical protein
MTYAASILVVVKITSFIENNYLPTTDSNKSKINKMIKKQTSDCNKALWILAPLSFACTAFKFWL